MNELLRSIYYNVDLPAGYASASKLYEAARAVAPDITLESVVDFLRSEHTYTLHHPARRNFRRNHVITHSIGEHCQSDIIDMQSFARQNRGNRFILTFIDVFSKKAKAVAIKTKGMKDVAPALDSILKEFPCNNLTTDMGKEYDNIDVKNILSKYKVRQIFAENQAIKAAVAERWNRTLKEKIYKYFTANHTRQYVDVLDRIVNAYNNTVHRSIGMQPANVTSDDTETIFQRLYGHQNEREMLVAGSRLPCKFRVGETVRLRYHLPAMEKAYFPKFTDQTYTIAAVVHDYPRVMYRVKDWENNILGRKFYSDDLIKVNADTSYRIEKIIKRRGDHVLVKWNGYPKRANSWIRKTDIYND